MTFWNYSMFRNDQPHQEGFRSLFYFPSKTLYMNNLKKEKKMNKLVKTIISEAEYKRLASRVELINHKATEIALSGTETEISMLSREMLNLGLEIKGHLDTVRKFSIGQARRYLELKNTLAGYMVTFNILKRDV